MAGPFRSDRTSLEGLSFAPEVRNALERLCEDISRAAGENLVGLILYGGLARGRYRPTRSDVNVVVLLNDTTTESLAAIAPLLRAAWRAHSVEPFILKPSEVQSMADVFPTKLLDIQAHHIVLMGEDPFAGLEFKREHLRLRTEQELRNMSLRMRRRFVSVFDDPASLASSLTNVAVSLKVELGALLRLAGKGGPTENTSAAVLEAAAVAFGLDRDALARVAAMRRDASPADDLPELYNRVLASITRAAEIADQME
ncbi:MAG TPA: nucleotidyltransferase domain-containing protein [Blastocatellia bacterium]|jgi:predicted nucleotidyltransferase|nr:nucleotidyltransferase domain-containing protein [Blastocatellia bacterium]